MRVYNKVILHCYIVAAQMIIFHSYFVHCEATPKTVPSETDFFSEKLDWNKVKMTKLRLLLLGELFKHQMQQNDVVWLPEALALITLFL